MIKELNHLTYNDISCPKCKGTNVNIKKSVEDLGYDSIYRSKKYIITVIATCSCGHQYPILQSN